MSPFILPKFTLILQVNHLNTIIHLIKPCHDRTLGPDFTQVKKCNISMYDFEFSFLVKSLKLHEIMLFGQFGDFDLNSFIRIHNNFSVFDSIQLTWVFINITDIFTSTSNSFSGWRGHGFSQWRPWIRRLVISLNICCVNASRKSKAISYRDKIQKFVLIHKLITRCLTVYKTLHCSTYGHPL